MALKSIHSASADGQFTKITIDTRRGTFNKIEVFKDGQTAPFYTVPITAATAGLFAIRFHELHPDLPPEQQEKWPPIVEYRLREPALTEDPPVEETPGQLKITYSAVTHEIIQGSAEAAAEFRPIRVALIFRAGTAAADKGWIDIDLDFDYPSEVANQNMTGKVWEMHLECPRVPFPLLPLEPNPLEPAPPKLLVLDPDGRLELLREAAFRVPAPGVPPPRHVAALQFFGVYETGKTNDGVRFAQGIVFAGTDENGHRKDLFVKPLSDQTAEVGFDLVNPIHLKQGKFVRASKYVLSRGDALGFGGAQMKWRIRAFFVSGVFANAAVDWFDVANFYRDWVRTRTSTLFRRGLRRDRVAPVDNMSPWTIVENYGLDSASEPFEPVGDLALAQSLEKHPMLVPGRTDALGEPDVPGNPNEPLPSLLVRVRDLFLPQDPKDAKDQVRLEAQIWGFEMGGFYRFLGGLPPICDVTGAPGKHAAALAWLQAEDRRIVPLATTDPLRPNFNRKRFGAHVRRQDGVVVDAIAQPFPPAIVQELGDRVDTQGHKFILNLSAYPQAAQLFNHGRRTALGEELVLEDVLSPFYGLQQRELCPSPPVIGIYLDEWLRDIRTKPPNGLFNHGFRLIEFMKTHFSGHYCYDRSHRHGSGAGYDNVIGWGAWHVQRVIQMLHGAATRGRLNPSFALTNEFLCPEPLVPFFEDFYDHGSSAARLEGDTRSLELRQSTSDANDDLQARVVPVFQYVYSQQITAKMNFIDDDPLSHPGYRENRIGAPAWPDVMLNPSLDTAILDFPTWRQMAKTYCDEHYSEASLGVAPAYQIVRPDGTTGEYRYSRCLQDVINLKSRIFRFGMAGVWGERIVLPATWIDGFYEYSEPAIEMALHAAHFQIRFSDYLRRGGYMLGPGQILSGNAAVSAWRVNWRTFDDAPDPPRVLWSKARYGRFRVAEPRARQRPNANDPASALFLGLLEFHRHKPRRVLARVRQRVGVAAGQPFDVPGLELAGHRTLPVDVAADLEVAHGHQQVRTVVMVAGHRGSRLQLDRRDAGAVADEEHLDPPTRKLLVATLLRPGRRRLAKLVILHQLDGHIAERLAGEVPGHVREVAGRETGLAVRELQLDRRLAGDLVRDVGLSQRDEDIVVPMVVQQRGSVRRHLDLEDADLFVGESQVMRGLGGDLDGFGRRQQQGEQEQSEGTGHPHHQASVQDGTTISGDRAARYQGLFWAQSPGFRNP